MADQKKTYSMTTATVPARPRSKSRRDGTGLTAGGASAMLESGTAGNAQRASHAETATEASHALRADEAVHADTSTSAKTAERATMADRANTASRADEAAHAATATNATTAERANTANTADTATRAQSAQIADRAASAARADQAQRATEAETLRTPNYSDGLTTGAGARIDAAGNAEFQSVAVRGFFRAAEYQINRIALSEGDVFHTENGLVKSAEHQADGRWKVMLQERFQGDVTGFRAGDILRGAYNGIGTSGGAAEIRTSWLRVEAVDAKAGTLTASLYADNQTPEGRNAPPVALMRLARWGNTTDPTRQSHIMESATDGRIVRRVKVSAPIVDGAQSDGFVVGKLPTWLHSHFGAAVADASDYVFARGIITQNILRYTPAGRPLAERVDRGLWSSSARYFYEQQNPETGSFEISRVWHDGALYELARGGNGSTAPAAQSTHWTLIQAKPKDGKDGDAGKSAPPTGANLIDGTSFRSMEEVRRWRQFERFTFDPSQTDRVHPLAQAVCALKDLNWIKGALDIAALLRPNTTYTISIYSKGAPGTLAVHYTALPGKDRYLPCNNVDRNKWTRYVFTFTTSDTVPDNANIFLGCTDMLAKTYFSALKLEEGEEATAWCLSENDKTGTPAANPNLWHCTDYVTRPHFTKGYLNEKPYVSVLPGGVDGDNYCHIEGNNEERVAHMLDETFGDRYPRGTWYTISFKCRGSGAARFHCYPGGRKKGGLYFPRIKKEGIYGTQNGGYLILYFRPTKEWTTHSLSFFYEAEEEDLPKTLRTYFSLPKGEDSYLDICHPKMETGEFATPWCLSEMDKKGDPGNNGRGIERVESFYLLTAENNTPNPNTPGWMTTAPAPTKERPWLWSYERTVYSDGKTDQTAVRLIGHYGKDGTNGTSIRAQYSTDARTWHDDFAEGDVWMRTGNGTTWGGALRVVGESGADGKSPVYDFAASTQLSTASGTTPPSIRGTWQDAPPTISEGEVLWYRLTAANGKITYGRLSGEKGEPGNKGKTSYIHMAYANSADGDDFTMEEDLGRGDVKEFRYFGIYSDFEEDASPNYEDYTWTLVRGEDGLTVNPNLLDGSVFSSVNKWKRNIYGQGAATLVDSSLIAPAVTGCSSVEAMLHAGANSNSYAEYSQPLGKLIPGKAYTFSVYVRGEGKAWLILHPNPGTHHPVQEIKPNEWTRVSVTVKASTDDEETSAYLRLWNNSPAQLAQSMRVFFCAPKLEEGDKATPWCPSHNDLRGEDGARGAAVRTLGNFETLPAGTAFQSGHIGEAYIDVVQVRQGKQVQYYQCKKSHQKSADKAPTANSEWWELGTYQGLIATDILLTKRALVENLGVEYVESRNAAGEVVFRVVDGTVFANTGRFRNIEVSGNSTFAGTLVGAMGSFSGTLNAVTGTFRELRAYGANDGVGLIKLQGNGLGLYGNLYAHGGDFRHTGEVIENKERRARMSTPSLWCSHDFGAGGRTLAIVEDRHVRYFVTGSYSKQDWENAVRVPITSSGERKIIVGWQDDGTDSGLSMPVDTLVFRFAQAGMEVELSLLLTQRVRIVNIGESFFLWSGGKKYKMLPGETREALEMGAILYEGSNDPNKYKPGAGLFLCASNL